LLSEVIQWRWADLALPCSWRESLVKFTHYPQSWWLSGRS
jgi:hypothetical protein